MKVHRGLEGLPKRVPPTALTIGNFDGVHRGHRRLASTVVGQGERLGATPTVVTFDPHPRKVLLGEAPPQLASFGRRCELLAEQGIARVVALRFDRRFSLLAPEDFVTEILVERLKARAITVGSGFRFGHKAAGDTGLLKQLGEAHGFEVEVLSLSKIAGQPVSSTAIRDAIERGDLKWAKRALGRSYSLDGTVVRGHRRGHSLGFPTANIEVTSEMCLPKIGVYAGSVDVGSNRHLAAVSVGTNPQFGENPVTVEAFLLDFDRDLYGRKVTVTFEAYLRDERRFDSEEQLTRAIEGDVRATRRALGGETPAKG